MVAVMSGSNSYNSQTNESSQNEPEVLLQTLNPGDIADQVTKSGFGRQLLSTTNEVDNMDEEAQDIDESEFKVPEPVIIKKNSQCN